MRVTTACERNIAPDRTASFIIAKGTRVLLYLYYAFSLRRFAYALLLSAAATTITSSVYVAFLFVQHQQTLLVLPCIALALEVLVGALSILFSKIMHERQATGTGYSDAYVPAICIEHLNERNVQLIVVVFGEALIKSTYVTHSESAAVDFEFGRSALGILISFTLVSDSVLLTYYG